MEDLLVLKIKFIGREKYPKKKKVVAYKEAIPIKLVIEMLLTTYFHIKLPLILPEEMIMNMNHKPSMNVDVEMIGQCGKAI